MKRLEVSEPVAVFHVPGRPVPKGDRRAIYLPERGHTVQFDKSPALKPWQAQIALFAKQAWGEERALTGPVSLTLEFVGDVPKSRPKTRRSLPVTRPDVDKLTRAVMDGLMPIIFLDDSQVVRLVATKEYAYDRDPGVYITVSEVSDARPTPYLAAKLEERARRATRGAEGGLKHMAGKKAKGKKTTKAKGKTKAAARKPAKAPKKAKPVKRAAPVPKKAPEPAAPAAPPAAPVPLPGPEPAPAVAPPSVEQSSAEKKEETPKESQGQ